MHELALCRSIYGIADRAREGRLVETIHVQAGEFRQVVPDTLERYWTLVTEGTELGGSILDVQVVEGAEFYVTALDVIPSEGGVHGPLPSA